jgi:hypothetical protein
MPRIVSLCIQFITCYSTENIYKLYDARFDFSVHNEMNMIHEAEFEEILYRLLREMLLCVHNLTRTGVCNHTIDHV